MIILIIVIIIIIIVIGVTSGIFKRQCPKCSSRGTSHELRRTDLGRAFSQSGNHNRIQVDYRCTKCQSKWIDVIEESNSI